MKLGIDLISTKEVGWSRIKTISLLLAGVYLRKGNYVHTLQELFDN